MKNKIKDLFNATKYKRKLNKMKNNYEEALESKVKDKETIIELQNQVIRLQEENDIYQKELIEEYEKDIAALKLKNKKKEVK